MEEVKRLRNAAVEVITNSTQRIETCLVPYQLIWQLEQAVRELDKLIQKGESHEKD